MLDGDSAVTGPPGSRTSEFPTAWAARWDSFPGRSATAPGIRQEVEGTPGFWYRFYNGPKGTVQFGMQESYFIRYDLNGVGAADWRRIGTSGEPKSPRTWCSRRSATSCRKKPGARDSPPTPKCIVCAAKCGRHFACWNPSPNKEPAGLRCSGSLSSECRLCCLTPYFLEAWMQPGPR